MSQMAAQETREAIGSGNAGAAGVSDLDYYGNWYASNDGSSFWVPDGAGAGWDPYGLGSWGFYGGLGGGAGGYVWISGYPWGWLPYHCGTWNYFNSFNSWGWIPGGGCFNNTWYPVGGYGNVPPRYRPLPRPRPVAHPTPGGGFHPPTNHSADRSGSRAGSDHPCTAHGGRTENYRERWRVSAIVIQDPESNCPGVRSTWITLFRPRREWFPQWRANRKRSGLPSDCTEPSV